MGGDNLLNTLNLNDAQRTVVAAALDPGPSARVFFWHGAIRAGKTWGSAMSVVLQCVRRGSGGQFILAGRSIGALERNVLPALQEHSDALGVAYRHIRSRNRVYLGGVAIHLFAAWDARSQDVVQGMTACGAFLDEAALMPASFVAQAVARCSEDNAKIIMTMNPSSPGHWIKRDWVDRASEMDGLVLRSGLNDNPSLSEDVKEFYDSAFTGHYHARMVEGDWVGAAGLVFPRWSEAASPAGGGQGGRYDVGIDSGASAPTAAVVTVREGDVWVASDEYYWDARKRADRTVAAHAAAIRTFSLTWGVCERALIDPSAASLRTELRKLGMVVRRANNDRSDGVQALAAALSSGRLAVHVESCSELVRELQTLEWDEAASEKGEDEFMPTADDHAVDALRYWCMDRMPPRFMAGSKKLPTGF